MRENNDQVMNSSNKQTNFDKKNLNQLKWLLVLMKSRHVKGQRSKVKEVSEEQMSIQTLKSNLAMFGMEYNLSYLLNTGHYILCTTHYSLKIVCKRTSIIF